MNAMLILTVTQSHGIEITGAISQRHTEKSQEDTVRLHLCEAGKGMWKLFNPTVAGEVE